MYSQEHFGQGGGFSITLSGYPALPLGRFAAVGRLPHHARVVLTEGAGLRLTQATDGHGIVPLIQAD